MDLPYTLTVKEAAALLRVKKSRAYELINQNIIPHVRMGQAIRIPRDSFLRWLNDGQALVGHD